MIKKAMPRGLKKVHVLMGDVGYYRKFLRDLPKQIRPIPSLFGKGVKFEFTPAMEVIVRQVLAELVTPQILVFPEWDAVADCSSPGHVYYDSWIGGVGAALEQEHPNGSVRPISYIGRANLDSERHWTPLDLEAGSIVRVIKRLRGYLWGTNFCIFFNHKAL